MLKNLAYAVIVIVGIYILFQIPFIQNYAETIYDGIIEKKDNITEEYNRVKDKVDDITDKAVEIKEDVEETVDTVSETVETIGDAADKIGDLVGGDDEEEDESEESDEDTEVTCTDEQKAAEICTLEYAPVCGDDGVTYGNACGACASGNVDTYVSGECVTE